MRGVVPTSPLVIAYLFVQGDAWAGGELVNKMNNKQKRWALVGVALLLWFAMSGSYPKLTLAQGAECSKDDDCPCWGTNEQSGITSTGIGIGKCVANKCDMSNCVDVEQVTDWVKDNPLHWIKSNPFIFIVIIGLLVLAAAWPAV